VEENVVEENNVDYSASLAIMVGGYPCRLRVLFGFPSTGSSALVLATTRTMNPHFDVNIISMFGVTGHLRQSQDCLEGIKYEEPKCAASVQ
jgi:hypothetical protein